MDGLDFMAISAWELEESQRISEWQKWIKQAEKLFGRSLDGCQWDDGYSLDGAGDAFEAGLSPAQYVQGIRR
jgi:hypothetical protein